MALSLSSHSHALIYTALLALCLAAPVLARSTQSVPLKSKHVLVVEEATGKILLQKNAAVTVPIASLTKLITAMVVLDANPDMDEPISIEEPSLMPKKRNRSHVPVGATLPRRDVLQLALISSDNRAAASLARNYPGGDEGFLAAVREKLRALGMHQTTIAEPTGISAANRSTPADLVKMANAAALYPEIARITTESHESVEVDGKSIEYRNTNALVGKSGWEILLSKTGTTTRAGRCLIMKLKSAGQTVTMVLLNGKKKSARLIDALNVRRFLDRSMPAMAGSAVRPKS